MRRLFGCPDIVSLTMKFLMARNFYRIFTENNPVMVDSKTFGIPEAKGLSFGQIGEKCSRKSSLGPNIKVYTIGYLEKKTTYWSQFYIKFTRCNVDDGIKHPLIYSVWGFVI